MSYSNYNFTQSTYSKWDTIQEDVADAYAYLDEEMETSEDEDFLDEDLTDEQVNALLSEMAEML